MSAAAAPAANDPRTPTSMAEIAHVLGIPVTLDVVVGSATMSIAQVLKLGRGSVIALDRKLGEPVDISINGRVVARGEIVVMDDDPSRLGVSLTEVAGT